MNTIEIEHIRVAHRAQPQGVPVAWMAESGTTVPADMPRNEVYYNIPLFTHPQHTEAEVQGILSADWNLSQDKLENIVRHILGVPHYNANIQ